MLAASVLFLVLVFVYFVGFARPPYIAQGGPRASLRTTLEFLANSLGAPVAVMAWPFSGVVVLVLMGIALAVSLWASRKSGQKRFRAIGLLLFLSSAGVLALAIGRGRGGVGEGASFAPRYVTFMIPALSCMYYTWLVYAPAAFARFLQMSVFAVACATLPLNWEQILGFHRAQNEQMKAFDKDLSAGTPAFILTERYGAFLGRPGEPEQENAARAMQMLHRAGVGLFRHLTDVLSVRRVSIRVSADSMNQVRSVDGVERGLGEGRYMAVDLAEPELVTAIRLKYIRQIPGSPASLGVSWKETGHNPSSAKQKHVTLELPANPAEGTKTILVNDMIDEIRIGPDWPEMPKLQEITLLVPDPNNVFPSPTRGGALDKAAAGEVAGWAWDQNHPNTPVQVDILDGTTVLAMLSANGFREDLRAAGIGRGDHGFDYHRSVRVTDDKVHIIRVLLSGTQIQLEGSPKTFLSSGGGSPLTTI